ncbi:hypothetical protein CJU79_17620 [Pseudomonas fragi]|uniref:SHOCT domain-containing protein n=1 Tax=Pseudomonas fragi TaxID=296 RepID=UPI000BA22F5C|nr:SHOCT domain-containing protein [Pseudomonas fragi]PAA37130.1 hypothetical protein CJU79_17620 [Pseudomonas fragi]
MIKLELATNKATAAKRLNRLVCEWMLHNRRYCNMFKKIKDFTGRAADSAVDLSSRASQLPKNERLKDALAWLKGAATSISEESARLSKTVARSDLAKDAASFAAIGAAVAVPLPIIGPVAGAAIGAGLGVFKNLTRPADRSAAAISASQVDIHTALLKLDDLRQKGILSEDEFAAQKKKVLEG